MRERWAKNARAVVARVALSAANAPPPRGPDPGGAVAADAYRAHAPQVGAQRALRVFAARREAHHSGLSAPQRACGCTCLLLLVIRILLGYYSGPANLLFSTAGLIMTRKRIRTKSAPTYWHVGA